MSLRHARQENLLKTIAKEGEIKVGPRNSAIWPQKKLFKSRRPCSQEKEKEVLAPEIQQSGPMSLQ